MRMAEAAEQQHRQRVAKEHQRLMQHYAVDAREKEQRDLEAKRAADEDRMRQARMMEEDRRVLEHR